MRGRPLILLSGIGAILLALSACDEMSLAENQPHIDSLDRLTAVEEIRIGSLEDPVEGFSDIRAVAVGEDGNVRVLDADAREVRVFTGDGEWIRNIGGPGEGPGEFESPTAIGLLGDTLWVHDRNAFRISWFDAEGRLLFTTPGTGVSVRTEADRPVRVVPMQPRTDGTIESTAVLPSITSADAVPVLRFDRRGDVLATLRWDPVRPEAAVMIGGRSVIVPKLSPTSPLARFADPDSVVITWSATPEGVGLMTVTRVGEGADTLQSRTLRYDAIPLPDSVVDSLIARPVQMLPLVTGLGEREVRSALQSAVDLPAFRAPIRRIWLGGGGSVLAELNTAATDASEWLVIAPDGTLRGRVFLPPDVELQHMDGDVIWAVDPDDLEVPWLVRYRIRDD